MIAALLIGLAVAALLTRPRPLVARPAAPPSYLPRLACVAGGAGVALFVGGLPGAVAGAAVALAGPRLIAGLDDSEDEDEALAAVLPLALELLGACLAGGAPPQQAVAAVATGFPGPCGDRLSRVASALALGSPPEVAWQALGDGRDAAGAAARALARAAEGGAPVAGAVQRVATEARRRAQAAGHARAARAGVLAVLPLGACFLPAFVLLGVVPAVVGLAGPLLSSLA